MSNRRMPESLRGHEGECIVCGEVKRLWSAWKCVQCTKHMPRNQDSSEHRTQVEAQRLFHALWDGARR